MARNRVNRRAEGAKAGKAGDPASGREAPADWRDWVDPRRVGWLKVMLAFVPLAVGLDWAGAPAVWRFAASGLAIIPLAGLLGEATDHLAQRLGPGIGGLLNATFGNAAELIIALFGLRAGLDDVVKASLTGSIIGNLLLVLGASLLAGGVKHRVQRFNKTAAGVGGTLMVLAAIGLLVPALFHHLVDVREVDDLQAEGLEHHLSIAVSLVLLGTYGLHLIFSLVTHRDLYNPRDDERVPEAEGGAWSLRRGAITLLLATAFVAWMSEILVGAVAQASHALGLSGIFVGVIVVAIVGNAAEHSTAVWMAFRNQMDLAVGIALSSALQIALFVAPVLVLVSYLRAHPMDLLFSTLEVIAVILAVLIARMVAEDGESNWLEGAMLLALYAILGVAFFYLPAPAGSGHGPGPSASFRPAQPALGCSEDTRRPC